MREKKKGHRVENLNRFLSVLGSGVWWGAVTELGSEIYIPSNIF